jgi:hypothetical protein
LKIFQLKEKGLYFSGDETITVTDTFCFKPSLRKRPGSEIYIGKLLG